jgi:hypothetical protein
MLVVLATLSHGASRKLTEIGFAIGAIGALGLAAGNFRPSRTLAAIGALLLAVGLALVIVVIHWGITPYWSR